MRPLPLDTGSDVDRRSFAVDASGNRPVSTASRTRQIRIGRAPEALSGRQQGDGFKEIGLARAIVTDKNNRPMIDADAGIPIIPEVAERESIRPTSVPRGTRYAQPQTWRFNLKPS